MKTRTLKELLDAKFTPLRRGEIYYKTQSGRTMIFEEIAIRRLYRRVYYGQHQYVSAWIEGEERDEKLRRGKK